MRKLLSRLLGGKTGNEVSPGRGDRLSFLVDDVDPVAEAEVYMAYGRRHQALDILKRAAEAGNERAKMMHDDIVSGAAEQREKAKLSSLAHNLESAKALSDENQALVIALIQRLSALEQRAASV